MLSLVGVALLLLASPAVGQTCYEEGVCFNSFYIHDEPAVDANDCLFSCQDYTVTNGQNYTCAWWDYSPISSDCYMFTDCEDQGQDPTRCPDCIHGESTCLPVYQCDLVGTCQGTTVGFEAANSFDDCLQKCKDELQCEWFSFSNDELRCVLFESCNSTDTTATDYLSGEKDCLIGGGAGVNYHKILLVGGEAGAGGFSGDPSTSAEVYDLEATSIAPNTCPDIPDLPESLSLPSGGYSAVNNKAIVCGGKDYEASRECFEYDGVSTSWTQRIYGLTYARVDAASAVVDADSFWVTGGWGGSGPVSSTEVYNPTTDRFSMGPTLPEPRMMHCLVKVNATQYLLVGGSPYITDVHMFEHQPGMPLSSGTWSQKADVPEARTGAFCGAVLRTDAYRGDYYDVFFAAGQTQTTPGRSTYIYNVRDDEWRTGAAYPELTNLGVSVPYGNTFVAVDGSGDPDTKSVYELTNNGYSDTWTPKQDVKEDRFLATGFLVPDNFVDCEGGTGGGGIGGGGIGGGATTTQGTTTDRPPFIG